MMKDRHNEQNWQRKQRKWNIDEDHVHGISPPPVINLESSQTAIIGHSFVTRLHDELMRKSREEGLTWSQSLDLNHCRVTPFLKGQGGAHVHDIDNLEWFITSIKPNAVVLEMGSNDLCGPRELEDIATDLVARCVDILANHDEVQALIWCHVIRRNKLYSDHKDKSQYNKDVPTFNRLVVEKIKPIARLHHWKHQGFQIPSFYLLGDGVHPNTEAGMERYIQSISRLCNWTKMNQAAEENLQASDDEVEYDEEYGYD